jgi:hypothetical protein
VPLRSWFLLSWGTRQAECSKQTDEDESEVWHLPPKDLELSLCIFIEEIQVNPVPKFLLYQKVIAHKNLPCLWMFLPL